MTELNTLNGLPVFPITWWRQNQDFPNCLLVTFKCPCGRTHCHGWPKDADPFTPQHRVAHCFHGPLREKGYYIVLQQPMASTGVETDFASNPSEGVIRHEKSHREIPVA